MSGFKIDIPPQWRHRIIWLIAAILAIGAGLLLAQRLHAIADRYDQFDFTVFYGWWTDYLHGGNPWTDMSGPMRGCNYTPAFVEIFSPLARLDQQTAFWIWQIAHLLCIVTAVLLLARGGASPLGAAGTIITLSLVLLSRPFWGLLKWSQTAPTLLVLLTAAWFCARRERPIAAGLWLALAALLKLFPAAAAGYFLFGRRWRALVWTIGFFAAGVLLTNPVRWIELTGGLRIAYHVKAGHGGITALSFVRKNIAHFAGIRVFEEPLVAVWGFTALIDLALLAIAIEATVIARGRADLDDLVFALWVALAFMMSPLAWERDILLLVPAFLFGLIAAWQGFQHREPARKIALIAGSAMIAVCIATSLIKGLPHPEFMQLLTAYLGAALILHARTRPELPRDGAQPLP